MNDRFKFRIAVFERYNTEKWEFIKFIENNDKVGVSTSGNVIQANVQGLIIHLPREKTPENVYRTMEAIQCTGWKDKNGKLIYEGDFLKDDENLLYEVTFNLQRYETSFSLKRREIPDYYPHITTWCGLGYRNCNKYEVVGNIYENEELLDEPKSKKKDNSFPADAIGGHDGE